MIIEIAIVVGVVTDVMAVTTGDHLTKVGVEVEVDLIVGTIVGMVVAEEEEEIGPIIIVETIDMTIVDIVEEVAVVEVINLFFLSFIHAI